MTSLVLDASAQPAWAAMLRERDFAISFAEDARALPGLFHSVANCSRESATDIADVSHIAVIAGPGSWTGIQCALAAGRSLAFAMELPLSPVSKLDLLAESASQLMTTSYLAALIPAGHGLAYGAAYAYSPQTGPKALFAERSTIDDWHARLVALDARCTVVMTAGVESMPTSSDRIRIVEQEFQPREDVLRAVLARSSPLTDADRFSFEPIFLHDPNPHPWSRRP